MKTEKEKMLAGEPYDCGDMELINRWHKAKQLQKEANGVPFMTIFTFGEYGSKEHGANTCGGLMLSFTAIGK